MGIYDRDYYETDAVRPLRPWDSHSVVTMLIVANVVVFVADFLLTANSSAVTRSLTLRATALTQPWLWWQFLTYGFAHADLGHLIFNMISLYFLGRAVEDRLGKWEFLRFYLATLILCGIVWSGLHFGENLHLLGASGAVTAVSMLFVFFYPHATLYLWMVVPVKAWVLGVVIIVWNLFTPTTSDGSVAYDVHLAGAALAAGYHFGRWKFGFLVRWWDSARHSLRARMRGIRVHRPAGTGPSEPAGKSDDDREADRILEKIYRDGEASLTRRERKFMEQYSRKVRQRRK